MDTASRSPHVVLLAQLGTPDAPTTPALRRYLREFLGDPMVIDLPRWLWLPILYGPILTFRPRKSAALYRRVWTPEGSPLMLYSQELRRRLQERLGSEARVELGMRYGNPSLRELVRELATDPTVERILLVPLFPQYSGTTTGTVIRLVEEELARASRRPRLDIVCQYHDDPRYVQAVAARAREHVQEHGEPDRWLISFHGIPQSYVKKGDVYPTHCEPTARAVAAALGLPDDRWQLSYQSRVGPAPWLQPYTNECFEALGREGVETLYVLCPGFAADCLETLDEIQDVGQEQFREAGGKRLDLIPCVNAHPAWVEALEGIVRDGLDSGLATVTPSASL